MESFASFYSCLVDVLAPYFLLGDASSGADRIYEAAFPRQDYAIELSKGCASGYLRSMVLVDTQAQF